MLRGLFAGVSAAGGAAVSGAVPVVRADDPGAGTGGWGEGEDLSGAINLARKKTGWARLALGPTPYTTDPFLGLARLKTGGSFSFCRSGVSFVVSPYTRS